MLHSSFLLNANDCNRANTITTLALSRLSGYVLWIMPGKILSRVTHRQTLHSQHHVHPFRSSAAAIFPHRSSSVLSCSSSLAPRVRYVHVPAAQLTPASSSATPRVAPRIDMYLACIPPGCDRRRANTPYRPLLDAVSAAPSRCRSSRCNHVAPKRAGTNMSGKYCGGLAWRAITRVASAAGGIECAFKEKCKRKRMGSINDCAGLIGGKESLTAPTAEKGQR